MKLTIENQTLHCCEETPLSHWASRLLVENDRWTIGQGLLIVCLCQFFKSHFLKKMHGKQLKFWQCVQLIDASQWCHMSWIIYKVLSFLCDWERDWKYDCKTFTWQWLNRFVRTQNAPSLKLWRSLRENYRWHFVQRRHSHVGMQPLLLRWRRRHNPSSSSVSAIAVIQPLHFFSLSISQSLIDHLRFLKDT